MKKLILTLTIILTALSLSADEILIQQSQKGEVSIQERISWLRDSSGRLSFRDVHAGESSLKFKKNKEGISNFGYTREVYWIRIPLQREGDLKYRWLLKISYPHLDNIEYHYPDPTGLYHKMRTGDLHPFSSRYLESRHYVFPLDLHKEHTVLYLRLSSHGSIHFPLSIIDSHTFRHQDRGEQVIYGLLFGILVIMIFYNLFIFFSVQERVYLSYVGHIFFLTLYLAQFSGFGSEYLWPRYPYFSNIFDLLATYGALFCIGLFIVDYLETSRISKYLHRLLLFVTGVAGILAFLSIFPLRHLLLHVSSILPLATVPLLIIIAFIATRHRMRQAYFFLAAWGIVMIAAGMLGLSRLGLIEDNFISRYSLPLGVILNVVLLSLGLADRINRMKNELFELNIGLEDKVRERTRQLEDALHEIEVTNEQLTERNSELTTAQRIRRKDMAMAINVQNSILPAQPPDSEEWDIAFFYQPMTGISGDFYDFYMEDNSIAGVGIFDVSGHGIASGLITMIAKSVIFRNFHQGENLPLEEVMVNSNRELQKEIGHADNYITGVILRFRGQMVEYANAAHNDILIKRGDEIFFPEQKFKHRIAGAFLGILNFNYDYESISFEINTGDYILLYTDGLNEARNSKDEIYTLEKIAESLKNAPPDGSAQEVLNHLIIDYHDFLRDVVEQHDDLTIVLMKKLK